MGRLGPILLRLIAIAGRIQVSAETMERLRDRFDFEPRVVEVKGLGALTTYLFGARPLTLPHN